MHKWTVLFVCRANQVRSQMAEAILTKQDSKRFTAFSAGYHTEPEKYPSTKGIHPKAYSLLDKRGYSVEELFVKSWHEFADKIDKVDFLITLCDKDLEEVNVDYPVYMGQPTRAIWGVYDPVLIGGNVQRK